MGRYYALAEKRDEAVAEAIKEQYMPKGEDGELPKSVVGAVLATAVRLDSLMGLFSLGMIPSGSKDPYALRRAAIGVIKNLIHFALKIDLSKSLSALAHMIRVLIWQSWRILYLTGCISFSLTSIQAS